MPRTDAQYALQQAAFAALVADAPLMALLSGGVHAIAPENAILPYATLRPEKSERYDSKTRLGQKITLLTVLRGNQPGLQALQQAGQAVQRILDGASLTISGQRCIDCRLLDTRTTINGRTRHIEMNIRFQIILEQL
jgi:hypothetical protein